MYSIKHRIMKNMTNEQKTILYTLLETIDPEINKNWLDLGCGSCKWVCQIIWNVRTFLLVDNQLWRIS